MNMMGARLCQVCGKNPAVYVCQSCGRAVCGNCFEPAKWSCTDCASKSGQPVVQPGALFPSLAMWLFFIAFAMIAIGSVLMALGSITASNGSFSGGAVILIGPIPIVLGAGPYSLQLIALAAVLTIVALGFYLAFRRRVQRQ